jgi:hypothetical protein
LKVIIYDLEAYLLKYHEEITRNQHKNITHTIPEISKSGPIEHFSSNLTTRFAMNETLDKFEHVQESNHHSSRDHILFKLLYIFERTCKYGSITILAIFMVEICVKIIFDPKSFKKILEILDGLVIAISFSLNVFLLIKKIEVHAITGLITLLR